MFEFEDNLGGPGLHDVFLSKYTESSCAILDFYISDSMQDMLDIDIRSEVATVVGGANEFSSLMGELPTLDLDTSSNDGDISWHGGPKWSSTSANDIYADVGACVNPNSVMPVISSVAIPSLTSNTMSTAVMNTSKSQLNLNRITSSTLPSPKEKKKQGCLWAMNPSKIAKMDEEVQKWSRKDPMAIRKAMVYPENLESLERGEMKHGSLNDSDVEQDDNEDNESEPEQEIDDSMINSIVPDIDSCDDEEITSQTEYDVDVSDMFDEVDIEDSKGSIQFALNTENGQTEFFECDEQPSAKRARLDINYSIAPATTYSIANTVNGTTQIVQKTTFAGQVQHQLLQQQNRRKITLVNRTA